MKFDFKLFTLFATKAFYNVSSTYHLEEILEVFRQYFECYEHYRGKAHPNIRIEQIEKIIETMPFANGDMTGDIDFDPDDYEYMIKQHFKTRYNNGRCDYNINHFFSGDIRGVRYYERFRDDEDND